MLNDNFELKNSKRIDSLNLNVFEYSHDRIGCKHIHLNPINPHNDEMCFMVAFNTFPQDDTGVAHILEHMVLCGSKNFPVRDPFFSMIKRSLHTFMNAFTGNDYTAYPFATQNKQDFKNLLDVYLDATFFSNISRESFLQEGWRLDFEQDELVFKGIVFNEMKGALSSTTSEIWHDFNKHFREGSTYQFNSGGNPEQITNLSYEKLKQFYEIFYHPSNAVFFTFGDINIKDFHHTLNNQVLNKFEKVNIEQKLKTIVKQEFGKIALNNNDKVIVSEFASEEEDSNEVVMAWVLNDSTDIKENFKNQIFVSALISDSAAPLLKDLENCNIGVISDLIGFDDSTRESAFMCGLSNVKEKDIDEAIKVINNSIQNIAEEGITKDRLESILMHFEMSHKEIKGHGFPYGLQLMMLSMSNVLHGGNSILPLDIDTILNDIKSEILDDDFVKTKVKELLINNKNKITYIAKSNTALNDIRIQKEKEKLEIIKNSLTIEDKFNIIENANRLEILQNTKEDLSILPSIKVNDIDIFAKKMLSKNIGKIGKTEIYSYEQATNGIFYLNMIIDLPKLSKKEISLLSLYVNLFGELGVSQRSYEETQVWQHNKTSGIKVKTSIDYDIEHNLQGKIWITANSLSENINDLCEVLFESFNSINFDNEDRISYLIEDYWQSCNSSIANYGSKFAQIKASSYFNDLYKVVENLDGKNAYSDLKNMYNSLSKEEFVASLIQNLHILHQKIISSNKQLLLIGSNEKIKEVETLISKNDFIKEHNESNSKFVNVFEDEISSKIAIVINTKVNFIAKSFKTVRVCEQDAPKLQVLSNFLCNNFLHSEIREKGGAYGSNCTQSNGVLTLSSYRDPNIENTLNVFEKIVPWMLETNFTKEQLDEAIINCIQSLDKPSSPVNEAKIDFIRVSSRFSNEFRNQYRKAILSTTIEDLKNLVIKYLKDKDNCIVVVSNKNNIDFFNENEFDIEEI